jgi:hypothetical protein
VRSVCAVSSEGRADGGADLSFSFLGEAGLLGRAELFHWAACEGRVTVAVTVLVLVFCDCSATLTRFGRAALWESWLVEEMG